MKFDPKVVPFDRSAAYVHHRAMKNRRDNNVVDALELLRRAVENSPDNAEYKLDLAELLSEMGCVSQSNRLLLDMLEDKKAPSECYYGLALNLLSVSDISGARRALWRYRGADPQGAHALDARRIDDQIQVYQMYSRPYSRRAFRASRLADLACERMKQDAFSQAARLFARSLELEPERDEVRALYATALELLGRHREALRQARRAAASEDASPRALCLAAQMYHIAHMDRQCRLMAERAMALRPQGMEMRMLIYTLAEAGMDREIGECARLAMQQTPYDRQLLHIRAVSLVRTGGSQDQAMKFWARILRIDPEDTIAEYYLRAAGAGELRERLPEYAYQVPREEVLARLTYVAEHLATQMENIEAVWREDARFRALLKWCLTVDNPQFRRAAVTTLAALDDPEAEATLREVLTRPEVACDMKVNALLLLRMRGADMERALPPSMDEHESVLPDAEELLVHLNVGLRQACRYANEVLEDEYGVSAASTLAMIMLRVAHRERSAPCTRMRIPAYAAALAYCCLSLRALKPSFARLCRPFGCAMRTAMFYAARIAHAIEEGDGDEPKAD